MKNNILILGIGNFLMGDEGVGVHAAERLINEGGVPGTDILDGGTGGFYLLSFLESYDTIILADATLDGRPPGSFKLTTPKFAQDFPTAMSTHDIGLKDMVSALQLMGKMPKIFLMLVSIESLQQQQVHLTPAIEAQMPALLRRIRNLVVTVKQQHAIRETDEVPY